LTIVFLASGAGAHDFLDRSSTLRRRPVERHVRAVRVCCQAASTGLYSDVSRTGDTSLQADLAPHVVSSLMAARRSAVRWRWVLAGQAIAAVSTLMLLGAHLEDWIMQALRDPALQAVRQSGIQLLAEFSVWITPILDLIPSLPTRLAPMRLPLPQLDGPAAGWGLLACSAIVLGLMRRAVAAGRVVPSAEHGKRPSDEERGRP
jgi:hypothetical protein